MRPSDCTYSCTVHSVARTVVWTAAGRIQAQSKTDRRSSSNERAGRSHSAKAPASSARPPAGSTSTTAVLQQALAAVTSNVQSKAGRSRSSGKDSSRGRDKRRSLAPQGEPMAGGVDAAALADVTHERDELRERLAALESSLAKTKRSQLASRSGAKSSGEGKPKRSGPRRADHESIEQPNVTTVPAPPPPPSSRWRFRSRPPEPPLSDIAEVGVRALRDFYAGSHQDNTGKVIEVVAQSPAQLGADRLQLAVVMLESRRIELPRRMHTHDARGFCEDFWSSAITINRVFAELHGYHFVLWCDVQAAVHASGCYAGDPWLATALPDLLRWQGEYAQAVHRSWLKLLPVYCALKRYDLVLYMDSSAYVADVLQPLQLLLHATRFLETGKAMLLANDHPRARWRALAGDGASNAATGIFAMRRSDISLALLRDWMGAPFPWGVTQVACPSCGLTWPYEQLAFNRNESSVFLAYREQIEVLPYATPLNGVHASYIPQLREWLPAYVPGWIPSTRALDNGKRCKILRAALACTLNETFPDALTRQCYTRLASSRQSTPPTPRVSTAVTAARDDERLSRPYRGETIDNTLHASSGACGWRPTLDTAGGLLPSTPRTRCLPHCRGWAGQRLSAQLRSDAVPLLANDTVHPYRFHTVGIKQCSPDETTVATQHIFPPESTSPDAFMYPGVSQDTLPAAEAWRLLVHAGGV